MELTKYNKLQKLGFTFWTKKEDIGERSYAYLIGESTLAVCSLKTSSLSSPDRERFINSIASIMNEDTVEKINIGEKIKDCIKKALIFDSPEIEALKECDIKLQTYSSLEKICSSTKEKKAFYTQFKKDLN